jgi:putative ABC transport system substrate-binding protein
MQRREFITFLGGATAWPLAARAQQAERVRWIGVLVLRPDSDQPTREQTAVLERSLAELGWTVGRNLAIDYQWGINDPDRARVAIGQIMRIAPAVIVAVGGPALIAAQEATRTVPIVFTEVSEPVVRGFVASAAQPGANTTGFTNLEATMGGKFVELLKEVAPHIERVTAVFNPTSSFATEFFRSAESAAQKLSVSTVAAHVSNPAEIDSAVTALAREPRAGLMFPPDGFTGAHRQQIVDLAARYRLPAIASSRPLVAMGLLMSYGADRLDPYRRAATYVDRILRGEKPADLPVQSPVKFELVINLKTVKTFGLTVPNTLLVLADEVIE